MNNNIIKKKNKGKGIIIILLIACFIITLYLMFRISYVLNYDEWNYSNIFSLLFERILNPFPFKITFAPYSSMIWLIWLMFYAMYIKEKAMPKPDYNWQGKEQGSNYFYSKSEVEDFISKKTDNIVPLSDIELKNILNQN